MTVLAEAPAPLSAHEQVRTVYQQLEQMVGGLTLGGIDPRHAATAISVYLSNFGALAPKDGTAGEFAPPLRDTIGSEKAAEGAVLTEAARADHREQRSRYIEFHNTPRAAKTAGIWATKATVTRERATRTEAQLNEMNERGGLPLARIATSVELAVHQALAFRAAQKSERADAEWGAEQRRRARVAQTITWFDPEAAAARTEAELAEQRVVMAQAQLQGIFNNPHLLSESDLQTKLDLMLGELPRMERTADEAAEISAYISSRTPHAEPHTVRRAEVKILERVVLRWGRRKMRIHRDTERLETRSKKLEEQFDNRLADQELDKIALPNYADATLERTGKQMPNVPVPEYLVDLAAEQVGQWIGRGWNFVKSKLSTMASKVGARIAKYIPRRPAPTA